MKVLKKRIYILSLLFCVLTAALLFSCSDGGGGTTTYTTIKTSSSDTSGWVSNSQVLAATKTVTLTTSGTKTQLLSASDLESADTVKLTLTEYTKSSSTDWITLYYADDWNSVLTQGDGLFGYPPRAGCIMHTVR